MVTATEQEKDTYLSDFAALQSNRDGSRPPWLRPIHETAIMRFEQLGFPTTKNELWRFTNTSPIAKTPFRLADPDGRTPDAAAIERFAIPRLTGTRLVFVDGRFQLNLSSISTLPRGVEVTGLGMAIDTHRAQVESHLTKYADYEQDAFTALNTAFIEDGAFVYVPRNTVVNDPIYLLFVSTAVDGATVTHPRNLIVTEADSQATVIEDYVSLGDSKSPYFTNAVTEIVVGNNATVSHYLLEREGERAYNVSTLRIQQGRDSNFTSHTVLLGGALVRNNVHPVLAGEGCHSLLNGLYVMHGRQHVDNHMHVKHAKPHCDSRQFYKGILDDHARAVFAGRIVVAKDAQKTDAKQSNTNLLLSEDAQANTQPQLEIYADDVKCTHGATVGQIDENAIFYLQTRGISEPEARAMLVHAFAGESLGRMTVEPIRAHLESLLSERLAQSTNLKALR